MIQFEDIYTTYWQKIYRICLGYVNDASIAEDLTQDIFVIVWKNLPKFRKEAAIGTWIYKIASNHCLRQVEIGKRMHKVALSENLKATTSVSIEPQIKKLHQYISELSEVERIIIALELEDVNQADIAEIMGISPNNVRVKIHRIKEKLTKKFNVNGNE